MVGLKNGHMRKNLTTNGEPQRSSWETQKKKKKKKKKPSGFVYSRHGRWKVDATRLHSIAALVGGGEKGRGVVPLFSSPHLVFAVELVMSTPGEVHG